MTCMLKHDSFDRGDYHNRWLPGPFLFTWGHSKTSFGQALIWTHSNMFVCGVSLKSSQLITELFPDCLKIMLFTLCFTLQGR